MANPRDDFSTKTKDILAKRVGFRCSNPNCRKPTCGANENPERVTSIGVAAHIAAAAKGGPRYDECMTPDERSSLSNGIWLCQSCSKLIDTDESRYTIDFLNKWKSIAEELAVLDLETSSPTKDTVQEQKIAKVEHAYTVNETGGDVFYCFNDDELAEWFNLTRREILKVLSSICREVGIRELPFRSRRYRW